MKKLLITLKTNSILLHSILAIIAAELLLLFLVFFPINPPSQQIDPNQKQMLSLLEFDPKVSLALFTGIPLFLITIIQLKHSSVLQRSAFIKDFASKLHNERELSESFYYLIYTYSNKLYKEFKEADETKRLAMQGSRKEGMRLYDPAMFQFSEEERRLDALLGFFDILGYHHHRGVVHIQDIAGVLGFQLAALATRDVIEDYRKAIPGQWSKSSFTKEFQSVAPYRYLEYMLEKFKAFSLENQKEIDALNSGQF